ncbi:MBL fold metallo-hydrolase [Pseudonocardia kujensis]|uniref:MBL fold metallo-hydrolase n=1 Tax=Pseudonocardia kujensis TaxID=1128675 RepID=UPI001E406386|nr:MBL fold metallo-hydrolase [Pseudonocardia kujensis]MCE0763500.1 MBL fold metallo-hydrolase [Pseudonocardia kujensis]
MATSAPLHSLQVGETKLTWIPDGIHHVRALEHYPKSTPEFWEVHSQYIDENDWLVMSIGGLLVQTGGRNVVIDTGFGPRSVADISVMSGGSHHGDMFGGELLQGLASAGVPANNVDMVVLSHLHPDHIGWTSTVDADGNHTPTFVNADYLVGDVEWDYWSSGPVAGRPGAPTKLELDSISSRLTLLDGASTPAPGLTVMPTPGHTPGHLSFVVSSGEERVIVLGDAVHCPAEISDTEMDFVFDIDYDLARRSKEALIRELEQPGTHMAGGHFPDAVFGRLLEGTVTRKLFT